MRRPSSAIKTSSRINQLTEQALKRAYTTERKSVAQIATEYKCSQNKVNYWLDSYGIKKRSISDALYQRHNPKGDPFRFLEPQTLSNSFLFGLGIGLYWGEGNKRNQTAVRLGNSDPDLVKAFVLFLKEIYGVRKEKFRFGLQIFSDMNPSKALRFWIKALEVPRSQFGKVVVTPSRGEGTYRVKAGCGVVTVYVSNVRLRNLICSEIEKLRVIR